MSTDVHSITSQAWVKEFLGEARIARLATCNPYTLQPHVTPVWFEWDEQCFWISAFRSTRKTREVLRNPKISVVIDTEPDEKPTRAIILEGLAEMITQPDLVRPRATSIYLRYLGETGILNPEPQSWLGDPENTIIRLAPQQVYVWNW